jgi:hypothetical protein
MENYVVQHRAVNTVTSKKIYIATLKNMHCNIEKISTATTKNMYCNIKKICTATSKKT